MSIITIDEFWTQLRVAQLVTGWNAGLTELELSMTIGCPSLGKLDDKLKELSAAKLVEGWSPASGPYGRRKVA